MIALLAFAAVARDVDLDGFLAEPPPIATFAADESAALARGELIVTVDSGQGGFAAIVVDAPIDEVWAQVVDFDRYVDFLPYVTASHTDRVDEAGDHTTIDCSLELTTRGVVTRYSVRNAWYRDQGWMAFAMLPGPGNPLDAATGWWRVAPLPDDPRRTLLMYSIDVNAAWWVPGFIRAKATDRAVPTVAKLIARRAEVDAGNGDGPP
jgi:ribosome-associated toxin RatA of RatAB toxin-antitoxin module